MSSFQSEEMKSILAFDGFHQDFYFWFFVFNFFLIFNSVAIFVRSLITLVPFLNMYFCGRPSSSFGLRFYAVSLLPHEAPPKSLNLSFTKSYLIPILYMLHLDRFQFSALLALPSGKLLTLRLRCAITGCKVPFFIFFPHV